MNPCASGQAYVDFIKRMAIPTTVENEVVYSIWDEWSESGIQQPPNLAEVLQNPNCVMENTAADIVRMVNEHSGRRFPVPYFAFAPFGHFSSHARIVDNGDWVVVIDNYMDNLYAIFGIVACSCAFSRPDQNAIRLHCECLKAAFDYFMTRSKQAEKVMHRLYKPIIVRDYELSEWGAHVGRALSTYMICHEIAHHCLGHTGMERQLSMLDSINSPCEATVQHHAWQDEFDADAEGMNLYHDLIPLLGEMEWARINDQIDRIPFLIFVIFEIYEKHCSLYGRSFSDASHPPPIERRKQLARHLFRAKEERAGVRPPSYRLSRNGRHIYCGVKEFADEYGAYIEQFVGSQ